MDIEDKAFTIGELEIISAANAEAEIWRKQAKEYKEQHEKDTSLIARLAVAKIKFKGDGCTCTNKPGDEYYCPVHGGEGSWIDLKTKSDMLAEKLGDWIVSQSDDVERSAKDAFGDEMKALGQMLYRLQVGEATDEN